MQVLDTVSNLAQLSTRFRRTGPEGERRPGMLGQLETRLTGVVVAALKEAFDRDRVRMDLERAQFEAERTARGGSAPRRGFAVRRRSAPSHRSG